MAVKIDLIYPALPPHLDGIGDYTAKLSHYLAPDCRIRIHTATLTARPIPGVEILPTFSIQPPWNFRRLRQVIAQDPPDWILLQYNPFSYGHWGFNPNLARVMARLKAADPAVQLALMVHEPFMPALDWKTRIMTTWQRQQLWSLGSTADVIFFSIEAWAKRFQPWFPSKLICHLPVGSNVSRVEISPLSARQRLGIQEEIVLGFFGSNHPSRLMNWIRPVMLGVKQAGYSALCLYIGGEGWGIESEGFRLLATPGVVPEAEVSQWLQAMDIYLAPFSDGVSTRRTSMMSGLQHGIPLVGTLGDHTDPILRQANGQALMLTPATDPHQYLQAVLDLIQDRDRATKLGQAGQRLYETQFDWPVIARQLLAHLPPRSI